MINLDLILQMDLRRLSRDDFGAPGRMLQLRLWQHWVNELLKQKAFKIPVHLGFGTEALVTAVDETMGSDDELVLTHRNAVFNMARAESLGPILDEYGLLETGSGGGVLGSMNLANPGGGISYSSSILGNNLSVACGLAFAQSLRARSGVVWVVTGDGAMEEGGFYEALVFARSHGLRVVFLVDNNDYSMASKIEERRCDIRVGSLCDAVGIPFFHLQGNDLETYVQTLGDVRTSVLVDSNPVCVEFSTALLNQHAGPTPGWPTDPLRIDINDGLVIGSVSDDPVAALRERVGVEHFNAIALQLGVEPLA